MRYERSIHIAAPPGVVWAVMNDVARWPEWTPSVRSVEVCEPGPLRVGFAARLQVRGMPAATWVVTELTEGRSFTWVTRTPGARSVASHAIEPGTNGCVVTLAVEVRGFGAVLLRPLVARASRRNLRLEAEGLKQRAESLVVAR